jgi:hypothetical protein
LTYFSPQAASVAAPARPKCPRYGSDTMPLRSSFSWEWHDGGGHIKYEKWLKDI